MNTDQSEDDQSQISPSDNGSQQLNEPISSAVSGQSLTDLVGALQSVDTQAQEAALNATSISDNS